MLYSLTAARSILQLRGRSCGVQAMHPKVAGIMQTCANLDPNIDCRSKVVIEKEVGQRLDEDLRFESDRMLI